MAKRPVSSVVILLLACGAQLMVVLDGLVVSVALPDMRAGLHLTATGLEWVVNGYLVTFAGLLLLAARAVDLIGHRRVFLSGVVVFTLASLAGGLAPNGTMLIAARLVQGAGAAALAPASLSLLTMTHTGTQRARAISLWSATSASAGALGLVLGGVITSSLGWRWVLLINVPIGVVLWTVASATLAATAEHTRRRVDTAGAVTVTATIGALTYAVSQAQQAGWTSPGVIVTFIASAVLLALLIAVEQRAAAPLIPLSIFRIRSVTVANTIVAVTGAVMTATLYFLSLYLQGVLDYSPLRTGLALIPMSVVMTGGAIACKSLLPRFGARRLVAAGGLTMAVGLLWLATIPSHSSYLEHILGPTLVWAAGASIVVMPCVALATGDIDPTNAGLASGLVNTARGLGGAIGLAALATVATNAATHSAATIAADATTHGSRTAFIAAAVLAGVTCLFALAARTPPTATPTSQPRTAEVRA